MDNRSPVGDEAALRRALNDEAKRLIVDCTYSGRGHQVAGQRWAKWNNWLGLPATIASTLLASGAGVSALLEQQAGLTFTLAALAAITGAAQAFLRPRENAEAHGLKGNRFISLRNEARIFREIDLRSDLAPDELAARLRDLRKRYADLNEAPPLHIPRRDYEAAKRSITAGESSYEDDPVWKELKD